MCSHLKHQRPELADTIRETLPLLHSLWKSEELNPKNTENTCLFTSCWPSVLDACIALHYTHCVLNPLANLWSSVSNDLSVFLRELCNSFFLCKQTNKQAYQPNTWCNMTAFEDNLLERRRHVLGFPEKRKGKWENTVESEVNTKYIPGLGTTLIETSWFSLSHKAGKIADSGPWTRRGSRLCEQDQAWAHVNKREEKRRCTEDGGAELNTIRASSFVSFVEMKKSVKKNRAIFAEVL